MDLLEELKELGVNVEEGLTRLNRNEALYKKLLGTFTGLMENYYVGVDFDDQDCKEVTEKAHAIKGAAGNLSITPIYDAYTEIVNLLRAGKPQEAKKALKKILPLQEGIVRCIEKHKEQ